MSSSKDAEEPAKKESNPPPVDSDEEDEDYVPGQDPDEVMASDDENDITTNQTTNEDISSLSITKQKAVDDAFNELFGFNYADSTTKKSSSKVPVKSKSAIQKQKNILSSIFGKHSSAKLMSSSKATAAMARPKVSSSGGMMRLERRVVKEVKRFAGQEICVEKVVMMPIFSSTANSTDESKQSPQPVAAAATSTSTTTNRKAKGLDNLLTEMSRPEKLSTISKTSTDWDLFKSKNKDATLKEQLESRAEGNEAFLVKKDFLDRVDQRKFELEKEERDRERASRGK
ncbi:hypothetical protein ACHAWC_000407 [Mediolabrus comicus]